VADQLFTVDAGTGDLDAGGLIAGTLGAGRPICQRSRNLILLRNTDAGWSSSVARWAHNPEVAGSNPAPATK
jgi:hypothetical protein